MNLASRKATILSNLGNIVDSSDLTELPAPIRGKVRDSFVVGDRRVMVTTDRLSCFDRQITTIPFKGQLLNLMSRECFADTAHIVKNHIIECPDPNIIVAHNCQVIPVEIIVRGYLAGGGWRSYRDTGVVSGIKLPEGLAEFDRLPHPILTPSTKAGPGEHDQPVSAADILSSGLLSKMRWQEISEVALALFAEGQKRAAERNLILVDTKYEFGLLGDTLILVDEVHTIDCSRYWLASSYESNRSAGTAPDMLDKETARRWLVARGYQGEGPLPEITDEWRVDMALHYWDSAEKICGKAITLALEPATARINTILRKLVKI